MPATRGLDPESRSMYGASLHPPAGAVLDAAIGMTYSLDFETALAVQVSLATSLSGNRDDLLRNPLALLEAAERNASRLAIYCEAGRIQSQLARQSRLCTLLERIVVEALAPGGGAFHPKMWVLRYRPARGEGALRMRLLVLSRNLTRDRSWDLSLCLDGEVGEDPCEQNVPLVDLLERLPARAVGAVPDDVIRLTGGVADSLRRTRWALPEGFESVEFRTSLPGRWQWKPKQCYRLAVISPFCDARALRYLRGHCSSDGATLVSRSEALVEIPRDGLGQFRSVSVLQEQAQTEDGEGDSAEKREELPLQGLHAKACLQESGQSLAVTVGSGNATSAALLDGRNVEVFATLTGKLDRVGGIGEWLGPEGFGRLLRPFQRDEVALEPEDCREAERRVEDARRELALLGLRIECFPHRAAASEQQLWRMVLRADRAAKLENLAAVSARPITRDESHARDALGSLRAGDSIEIAVVPLVDVTKYIAFRLEDMSSKAVALFSLGLPLTGLPDRRHQAVLRWLIDRPDKFLEYLRLLLADTGDPLAAQAAISAAGRGISGGWPGHDEPVLEAMVRALADGPHRLDAIRRLMERIEGDAEIDETEIVPSEFLQLWDAFRTVLRDRERIHG